MQFEALQFRHSHALLEFENQNRQFFETLIAPRAPQFYTESGVEAHIQQCLDQTGIQAFVLIDNHSIVARANLRGIQTHVEAEIGYRVSKEVTGRGIGSACVKQLISEAKLFDIRMLCAYVMANNPASEKVLTKNGFQYAEHLPNRYKHRGQWLDGGRFTYKM